MDSFFEQLLNGIYHEGQEAMAFFFGLAPYRSTIVKFGGFQFSHNWYGKTNLAYDKIGDRLVFTKTIYFNRLFLHQQFGLVNSEEFALNNLVKTIAHEIAHCLLADYHPSLVNQHNWLHWLVEEILAYYLSSMHEINMLEELNKQFSFGKTK